VFLELGVRVWVRLRDAVRVRDAEGTKRLSTKRLAYEISESRLRGVTWRRAMTRICMAVIANVTHAGASKQHVAGRTARLPLLGP